MSKRPRPLRVPVDEVPRRSAIDLSPANVEAPERSEPEVPRASRPPMTARAEPLPDPGAPIPTPSTAAPASSTPPTDQPMAMERTTVDLRLPRSGASGFDGDLAEAVDAGVDAESVDAQHTPGAPVEEALELSPPEAPSEPPASRPESLDAESLDGASISEDSELVDSERVGAEPATLDDAAASVFSSPSKRGDFIDEPTPSVTPRPKSRRPKSAPPPASLRPSSRASAPPVASLKPSAPPSAPTPTPSDPPLSELPSEPTEPALRVGPDPDQVTTVERRSPHRAKDKEDSEEVAEAHHASAVIIRGMVRISEFPTSDAFEDEQTPSDSHGAMAHLEPDTFGDADVEEEADPLSLETRVDRALSQPPPADDVPTLDPAMLDGSESIPPQPPLSDELDVTTTSGEMDLDDEILEIEEDDDRPSSRPPPPPAGDVAKVPEAAKMRRRAWFETFFSDDYLRTVQPPSDKNVAREVDFIERALGLAAGASILDVGCGLGLHAIELSKRGYVVVGLDLSDSMLGRARSEAKDLGLSATFIQGDMREMTFDFAFDAVLCWGTSFGYFDDDKNRQTIARLYQALKPKGMLLLDVVNRDHVIQQQPNLVWFEGDGCVCMEESKFNYFQSRLQVKRTVILDDGRQRENSYSLRLYAAHEVGKLLHLQGFRVAEFSGRLATPGVFFGATSPRMMILAERRVEAAKAKKEPPAPPPNPPTGTLAAPPASPPAAPPASPPAARPAPPPAGVAGEPPVPSPPAAEPPVTATDTTGKPQ